MELPVCSRFHNLSHTSSSFYPYHPKYIFNFHLFHGVRFGRKLNSKSRPTRMSLCSLKASQPNCYPFIENKKESGNSWEGSECVDVFGIGSRKDAVLDFCLNSQSLWPSLRFWNVLIEESAEVQLQQRLRGKDVAPTVMEDPSALLSLSKAVILVATAAYGSDDVRVFDILKGAKSANRLVIGIILKPFSFEGRRRQDEVKYLAEKLEEYSNLSIVVNTDVLLEKDLVTLDEALKTANTAVFMAINAISILLCENQKKLIGLPQNSVKEVKVLELVKIIESYKEANIGFGAGYNIKTSIMRAIYDCPFLPVGLKDFDGIVVCILASSAVVDNGDINAFMHTFRQTTEYAGGILVSVVHDSNLETSIITSTVIAFGQSRHQSPQESSIFFRLAQHFPFISKLLRRHHQQSQDTRGTCLPESSLSKVMNSPESGEMPAMIAADRAGDGFGLYSDGQSLCNEDDEMYSLSGFGSLSEHTKVEFSETSTDLSNNHHSNTGEYAFQGEVLVRHNLGPGCGILEEWANEGNQDCEGSALLDNLRIYKLPVGIKPSEELKNSLSNLDIVHQQDKVAEGSMNGPTQVTPWMSWDVFSDAGEVVSEFYDSASAVLRGTSADVSKKQGLLSVRAASMLEAERDSQKKWNPIVEMKYKGGIYRGHCQGGLPEGKGQLSLRDGSIYDGMWRYGKKSGLGSFYFSNGDVYQGSWRDDVIDGKGWLYFHTGDRWFANFWKGKANGEGRFYSKLGEIFFGHFKDGWRHGHFLCINIDGTRCLEIWNEGILVSRKQLDADSQTS